MSPRPTLAAVVLAGGRSTRFKTQTPKVLHPLCGRPLIAHVLRALSQLHRTRKLAAVVVVVPPGGQVERALKSIERPFPLSFAVQDPPLGTGDATRRGLRRTPQTTDVIVVAGDSPLITGGTLKRLVDERRRSRAEAAVLTAEMDDPGAYGRVVRDNGRILEIVEARDATSGQLKINEVNASTYCFERRALARALPKLSRANAQAEYYLTDAVRHLDARAVLADDAAEALGANTRAEFAGARRIMQGRILDELLRDGVTIVDPDTTYVDAGVTVGADTTLLPNTFLEGATTIGSHAEIGPNTRIVDTVVEDGAHVTFAVVKGSRIGPGAEVGPFAHLRPGTRLRANAKAGEFVGLKNTDVGEGTKVPHLSYLGDATIGDNTNIGAGTITCNYDGVNKHPTNIGAGVFIGTNNTLIAPVTVGDGAYTGAHALVNRDVEAGGAAYGVPAKPRPRPKHLDRGDSKRG